MPPRPAPPTWRLLELLTPSGLPCAGCGQVHRYLMRMTPIGDCMPVLFPPGVPAPRNIGVEIDAHLACEGCGARFEDLEAYRVHPCAVHDR